MYWIGYIETSYTWCRGFWEWYYLLLADYGGRNSTRYRDGPDTRGTTRESRRVKTQGFKVNEVRFVE